MKLIITKPDGTTRTRVFANRAQAAEHGVFYFLLDTCHVPEIRATAVAVRFAALGATQLGGYTFTEADE